MNPREKCFRLSADEIKDVIPPMGGCMATDRILVDGAPVGYMLRTAPTDGISSGWTFMAGDESQAYVDNADNWAIYEVNTICNYDPAIIPYLDSRIGTAFGRETGTERFIPEAIQQEPS